MKYIIILTLCISCNALKVENNDYKNITISLDSIVTLHDNIGLEFNKLNKDVYIFDKEHSYTSALIFNESTNSYCLEKEIHDKDVELVKRIFSDSSVFSLNGSYATKMYLEKKINYLILRLSNLGIDASDCINKTYCVECEFWMYEKEVKFAKFKSDTCLNNYIEQKNTLYKSQDWLVVKKKLDRR